MITPFKIVTEFWKITHIGEHETIRIFMFNWLLLRAEHTFKKHFKGLLIILCIENGLKSLTG